VERYAKDGWTKRTAEITDRLDAELIASEARD
jgi:fibronectin type 3 domain-containing protein